MKKLVRSISLMALLTAAVAVGAKAQTVAKADTNTVAHRHHGGKNFKAFKAILTPEQQAMLKENREKQKEAHKAFKATLTPEQQAVLKDKTLSRKDKMEKLKGTLTADQQKMMADNKAARKANRKAFVATLSDTQKAQMKELFKNSRQGRGVVTHRGDVQKS
ncbi:hypothetical protein [Mucilaginibacter sp. KACC 22063]|uniref:hypothetical protein n=1 Tax=Mucilaginibacter sp. KACC 22063 TaxID=3025666 RepID=UPI002366D36D|nr:hypothetical protein [Mucilaginibacter sp. KACC 22063]WDF54837.1 hypothetical protein PQ461_18060 [Mucilaginibacter sp. KACC 22063]